MFYSEYSKEEKEVWRQYFCSAVTTMRSPIYQTDIEHAARIADSMLEEDQKRFSPKPTAKVEPADVGALNLDAAFEEDHEDDH